MTYDEIGIIKTANEYQFYLAPETDKEVVWHLYYDQYNRMVNFMVECQIQDARLKDKISLSAEYDEEEDDLCESMN